MSTKHKASISFDVLLLKNDLGRKIFLQCLKRIEAKLGSMPVQKKKKRFRLLVSPGNVFHKCLPNYLNRYFGLVIIKIKFKTNV